MTEQLALFVVPTQTERGDAALKAWETLIDAAAGVGAPPMATQAQRIVWCCTRFKRAEAVLAALVASHPATALKASTDRHMAAWTAIRAEVLALDEAANHVLAFGHTARVVEQIGADCAAVLDCISDMCLESLEAQLRLKVAGAAAIARYLRTQRRAA